MTGSLGGNLVQIDFWEVGQGDCTVITLGNGEFIIIDAGPAHSFLPEWLCRKCPQGPVIRRLILTHNHLDHIGGVKPLLKTPDIKIDTVFLLNDTFARGDRDRICDRYLYDLIEAEKRSCLQIEWIAPALHKPQVLWEEKQDGAVLKAVYPSPGESLTSRSSDATSAIIVVEVGGKGQIVWGGDADLRKVYERVGDGEFEILFGPHHGSPKDRGEPGFPNALQSIRPANAVFSLGTYSSYNQRAKNAGRPLVMPSEKVVNALARNACNVVCTQLTKQCDANRVQRGQHVFQGSMRLGVPPAPSGGVSCRGAMRWEIRNGNLNADPWGADHRNLVKALARPMCLVSAS